MKETLLKLEKSFFVRTFLSDEQWLDAALHENFLEYGKSGELYHKEDTVKALLLCDKDREIRIYEFPCDEIAPDCWLAHYITVENSGRYYRTSVWVKEEGRLQLRFHQASPQPRNK